MHVLSPILYVDDFMLFYTSSRLNIEILYYFSAKYAHILGKYVNPFKSTIYDGSIIHSRLGLIASSIGFNLGTLPFDYFGVPFLKGRPKALYFQDSPKNFSGCLSQAAIRSPRFH